MKKNILALAVLVVCGDAISSQQLDEKEKTKEIKSVKKLTEVYVFGKKETQPDSQQITQKEIKIRPAKNPNITELLKTNPNVQFSRDSGDSKLGGEIQPDAISFHGEKFYRNNFILDGISNNNMMNPGSRVGGGAATNSISNGGPETFWVGVDLIKQLNVYDSNVSAEYGNFAGGVIDAELIDADPDKHFGKISYRTTRDSWAKFHIDEKQKENFKKPRTYWNQSKFVKHYTSLTLNQPVNDNSALLFYYDRHISNLEIFNEGIGGKWEKPKRFSETFLLKGGHYTANNAYTLSVMNSPHYSDIFYQNYKNSKHTNSGGGWRINGKWINHNKAGTLTSILAYTDSINRTRHSSHEPYKQHLLTPSIDWWTTRGKYAYSGGLGEIRSKNQQLSLNQKLELLPFVSSGMDHNVKLGWGFDYSKVRFDRLRDTVDMWGAKLTTETNCDPYFCIPGEQYITEYQKFPKFSHSGIDNNSFSFYVEDTIRRQKFSVRPGIRYDYNQRMKNHNIAPRLMVNYHLSSANDTQFFGGVNRYYTTNIAYFDLSNGLLRMQRYKRAGPLDKWESKNMYANPYYVVPKNLKTPYSDELNLGYSQIIAGHNLVLKWVGREGRNQLATSSVKNSDGFTQSHVNNKGRTKGNNFSLEISSVKPAALGASNLDWRTGMSFTKNTSNTSGAYYSSILGDYEKIDKVIFNNKLTNVNDLPAMDFNSRWKGFVELNIAVPAWRFNWSNLLSYGSGFRGYISVYHRNCELEACGSYRGPIREYQEKKFNKTFVLDWRFNLTVPAFRNQYIDLSLDVNNVSNRRVRVNENRRGEGSYQMGRQFWLSASYRW